MILEILAIGFFMILALTLYFEHKEKMERIKRDELLFKKFKGRDKNE